MDFVHLHLHTEYSLLDGACRINKVIKQAKELGQKAIAITDHGVMYGVVDFYKEAKKQGIKPIIGCEVYLARRTRFDRVQRLDARPHHLILLCKNETGYKNLMKLVSKAYTEGFHSRPRIDKELLEKYNEGLIAMSSCISGEIPRLIEQGNYEGAKEAAIWYKKTFEKDSFYLEVQDHGMEIQKSINRTMYKLAKETDIGLVASNDCHYIEKKDSKMQNILVCIQTNRTIFDENNMEFSTQEFYLKSASEMAEIFPKEALENTVKIAQMCNFDFTFGEIKLPKYTSPEGKDNLKNFTDMCSKGLEKFYGKNPSEEIINRLEYEIKVIVDLGYVDYFLIVQDFIAYAISKDIPVGPGRGSGAGSLAAYCIGITGIDPIKYGLIFERFLNPERITMPDFDIDFCYERRQEVIDYVVNKYGKNHVAQIISFGTMAARAAVRDVGRAMGVAYGEVDKLAKAIPFEHKITLKSALEKSSELKKIVDSDNKIKELYDMAIKVEGMPRHASTHAAGVVITSKEVDEYVPLALNDEAVVTQYDMDILEELGLLKMDFLGLRTLTVIKDTERMVQVYDKNFKSDEIPLDDKKVYDLLSKGETEGIFQFESSGMRRVLERLKPEYFEDLIAVISLYRPGPMDSIPQYIESRHDSSKLRYKHKLLEPILKETYGTIVYQEQVMEVFRELAGYSYARADLVRRAMASKNQKVMEEERNYFINGLVHEDGRVECVGAVKNGVSKKIANDIFNEMSSFASYAFNKSHAAAYALISYRTAYLKSNYTKEFMAASLTSILESSTKVTHYILECERMGINILPPDINYSNLGFTVDNKDIRFGLLAIKNLGKGLIEKIVLEREKNGNFLTFYDFCSRLAGEGLNKRGLESLIKAGAMDSFMVSRRQLILNLDKILNFIDERAKMNLSGQVSLFDSSKQESINTIEMDEVEEFPLFHKLAYEKEILGFYISGHPLDEYKDLQNKLRVDKIINIAPTEPTEISKYNENDLISIFAIITKKRIVTTKKNKTMAFLTLEDTTGIMEGIVFPTLNEKFSGMFLEGNIVYVKGRVSVDRDGARQIAVLDVFTPEMAKNTLKRESEREVKNKGLYLRLFSKSSKEFNTAMKILEKYSGSSQVFLYFKDSKTLLKAPSRLCVATSPGLISELKQLLGEKNVAIKR